MSKRRIHVKTDALIMQRLRALRIAYGVSQSDLAEQLDISVQQMQKYESCLNSLSVGRLNQIAQLLKVDINYFFQDLKYAQAPLQAPPISYLTIEDDAQRKAVQKLIISLTK